MGRNLPLRMVIVGPDRFTAYHAESIRLREDLVVQATCDPRWDGKMLTGAGGPMAERRLGELLQRDDVDCVLFAGWLDSRAALAEACLVHGKDVAFEPRPCDSAAQLRLLIERAARNGKNVCILPIGPDRSDLDVALEVVHRGCLGRLRSARLMSWRKGMPLQNGEGADAFLLFAYQYVDEALQLLTAVPRSVFARVASTGASDEGPAFTITIAFDGGADAVIDIDSRTGAVVQTGWVLAGERGGYCGQRIYVTENSGEVCDVPVTQEGMDRSDPYRELLSDRASESAKRGVVVLQILDAARQSADTGQAVALIL